MMIAYNRGDLFDSIVTALSSEANIIDIFKSKMKIPNFHEDLVKLVLDEILTRFKNIRGRWFIKKIKGQKKQNTSHSTRKQVQVKTEIAIATAEVRQSDKALKTFYINAQTNIEEKSTNLYDCNDDMDADEII